MGKKNVTKCPTQFTLSHSGQLTQKSVYSQEEIHVILFFIKVTLCKNFIYNYNIFQVICCWYDLSFCAAQFLCSNAYVCLPQCVSDTTNRGH